MCDIFVITQNLWDWLTNKIQTSTACKKVSPIHHPAIPFQSIHRNVHIYLPKTCTRLFIATLCIIAPLQDTASMFTNSRSDQRKYDMFIK